MGNQLATIIVLYYPNIELLKDCIKIISSSSDSVIIVNNTHNEKNDTNREMDILGKVISVTKTYRNVTLLDNGYNLGLSKAYNIAIGLANKLGMSYYLILDQDSIVNTNLITSLIKAQKYLENNHRFFILGTINKRQTISIIERIENAISKKREKYFEIDGVGKIRETNIVINSGMFLAKGIFNLLGGFNENLFIDAVDLEFCYRAKRNGCKIFQYLSSPIMQNVGDEYILTKLGISLRRNSLSRQQHIVYDTFNFAKVEFKYSPMISIKLFLTVLIQSVLSAIFLENKRERFHMLFTAFFSLFSS